MLTVHYYSLYTEGYFVGAGMISNLWKYVRSTPLLMSNYFMMSLCHRRFAYAIANSVWETTIVPLLMACFFHLPVRRFRRRSSMAFPGISRLNCVVNLWYIKPLSRISRFRMCFSGLWPNEVRWDHKAVSSDWRWVCCIMPCFVVQRLHCCLAVHTRLNF